MPRAQKKVKSPPKSLSPNQQLQRLARKWIRRLNLTTFNKIQISFAPESEMDEALGVAYWTPEYKTAVIKILDPEKLEEDDTDVERTLVHELLHIMLQGHRTMDEVTKIYDPTFEAALNVLADVLVDG